MKTKPQTALTEKELRESLMLINCSVEEKARSQVITDRIIDWAKRKLSIPINTPERNQWNDSVKRLYYSAMSWLNGETCARPLEALTDEVLSNLHKLGDKKLSASPDGTYRVRKSGKNFTGYRS